MATIGRKYIIPKGIVTVSWYWTDDGGKLNKNKLKVLLYFPDPPVNILSATSLSESMKDDEVTWVTTIRKNLFLLGILGGTKRQQLTHKCFFQN